MEVYCEGSNIKGKPCPLDDAMAEIKAQILMADMLVIASPIYYHGVSGQLKCTLDRFYSAAYPRKPRNLKKVAIILLGKC